MTHELSAEWFRDFANHLEDVDEFETEWRHFDGSIRLDVGEDTVWIKIYRGQVLEVLAQEAEFGSTFSISGPVSEWERLLTEDRNPFGEQQTLGLLEFGGNALESTRMIDGLNVLVNELRNEMGSDVDLDEVTKND